MNNIKIHEKECQGNCPNCGSDNINWHDSDIQEESIIYNAICDDCDLEFQEEYSLQYKITTFAKEENEQ